MDTSKKSGEGNFEPSRGGEGQLDDASHAGFLEYISTEDKISLVEKLRTEFRDSIRQAFARFQSEIERAVEDDDLAVYYSNLRSAWLAHNTINQDIDRFLAAGMDNKWMSEQWADSLGLLGKIYQADHTKNVYSAGLKKKLEKETTALAAKYGLDSREQDLLRTPSEPAFHQRVYFDHLKVYLMQEGVIQADDSFISRVKEIYHNSDDDLFSKRLKAMPFYKVGELDEKTAADYQRKLDEFGQKSAAIKKEKQYFMLGRKSFETIDKLLILDNWYEYLWSYNLKGMPDLIFRKLLMQKLQLAGKLDESDDIFSIDIDKFKDAMQ